jgi:Tfp pilus assembly protein PilV
MFEVGLAVVFLLVAVLGTLGLWYAIERETEYTAKLSRADAERAARQDTDDEA